MWVCIIFTFQSGYIQIVFLFYKWGDNKSLHSNLVIFKWYAVGFTLELDFLYIPIWLYSNLYNNFPSSTVSSFTFQSGYIQINIDANVDLPIPSFTFQSGYIQIDFNDIIRLACTSFTFQSGYIQMVFLPLIRPIPFHLYIPIWLYSIFFHLYLHTQFDETLHSNLVIFKFFGEIALFKKV